LGENAVGGKKGGPCGGEKKRNSTVARTDWGRSELLGSKKGEAKEPFGWKWASSWGHERLEYSYRNFEKVKIIKEE